MCITSALGHICAQLLQHEAKHCLIISNDPKLHLIKFFFVLQDHIQHPHFELTTANKDSFKFDMLM